VASLATKDSDTKTIREKIVRNLLNARKNKNRQRSRELLGGDVRVPSSFWERVESDYQNELDQIDRTGQ
jgi:hypothetical protein